MFHHVIYRALPVLVYFVFIWSFLLLSFAISLMTWLHICICICVCLCVWHNYTYVFICMYICFMCTYVLSVIYVCSHGQRCVLCVSVSHYTCALLLLILHYSVQGSFNIFLCVSVVPIFVGLTFYHVFNFFCN